MTLHKHNKHTRQSMTEKKRLLIPSEQQIKNLYLSVTLLQVTRVLVNLLFISMYHVVFIFNRQNVPDHFWTNAHKHRWRKKRALRIKVRIKRESERKCRFRKLVLWQYNWTEEIKECLHFLLFSWVDSITNTATGWMPIYCLLDTQCSKQFSASSPM